MPKRLFLIHGRSWKPPKFKLKRLWVDALRHGIERDFGSARLAELNKTALEWVYFGDLSNDLLTRLGQEPSHAIDDTTSRRRTLNQLKEWGEQEFTRESYRSRPGKDALKEALADSIGAFLGHFHLAGPLITMVSPDMAHYWEIERAFGGEVRWRLIEPLAQALARGDDVMIIAHSLGSLIAWDALWILSHEQPFRSSLSGQKVSHLMTIGSPLGDSTAQRNLLGHQAERDRRHPTNLHRWTNIAAEDDYISHDGSVADDFEGMVTRGLVSDIRDLEIFNLALRRGKSNPHASAGYLVHPILAKEVNDWLG